MGSSDVNVWDVDFVIRGEPASAKNSRRLVSLGGKPRIIKSSKAMEYLKMFRMQCKQLDPLITGDVAVMVDVYYKTRRPDLACMDLIMDVMQGLIYENDRQVKASQSLWNLDKENPRARIRVRSLDADTSAGLSLYRPSEIWGGEI